MKAGSVFDFQVSKMADAFAKKVMRDAVGALCKDIGWDGTATTAVDILSDVLRRYLLQLAKASHNYAEHFGRTEVNLDDVGLALTDAGMQPSELEEYVQNFDPVLLPYSTKVPVFPLRRESKLNFLRPGSDEVLSRPVHVHEYMPPMIFVSYLQFVV